MKALVIAEIGVNHDGELNKALQLVDAAARAGADVVKFQTFRAASLASHSAPKADYQRTVPGKNQRDLLRSLELSEEDHERLLLHCASQKVEFLSTGFDQASVDFLVSLGIKRVKVPSGEITNLPLLRHIGRKKLPILLSTGMANLGEIETALGILESAGTTRETITVLHCTTAYPASLEDVNLRAMDSIRRSLHVAVGYSDHTLGGQVAIAATALGAAVIEKHITLDRSLLGPDHAASMEPDEFSQMVKAIRDVETAMGDGIKRPSKQEELNISKRN